MTNVRQLNLPQWRRLAEKPENRCIIPLTEFCEWSREKDPEMGIKGEMWFNVIDQPVFGVAGFWQAIGDKPGFAMVTCDANELVKPIHPKAMITILHENEWGLPALTKTRPWRSPADKEKGARSDALRWSQFSTMANVYIFRRFGSSVRLISSRSASNPDHHRYNRQSGLRA
jgi:putative SOS response-associated peptidase YedK